MNKTIRLFILAGQSNMAGRADASGIPVSYRNFYNKVFYSNYCGFLLDHTAPFFSTGLRELGPCQKHQSTPNKHFGPELSFAERITKLYPEDEIVIIKVAVGGSSLSLDWKPDALQGLRLYSVLLKRLKQAEKELYEKGLSTKVEGFFWMQGEGDTLTIQVANQYEENLKNFIIKIRKDLGNDKVPFIIGRIMNRREVYQQSTEIIQNAQSNVSKNLSCVYSFSTDDLPDKGDSIHYNEEGILKLGKRFAEVYIQSIK